MHAVQAALWNEKQGWKREGILVGRVESLARQRRTLERLIALKFGDEFVAKSAKQISKLDDHEQIEQATLTLVESAAGEEFLNRLRTDSSPN